MMKIGLGHAEGLDTLKTVDKVLKQCEEQLAGSLPQAGIVFCSSEFDPRRVSSAINAHFPGIQLIGCTTSGELSSRRGFSEDSIALLLFHSDVIEVAAGLGRRLSDDPAAAVRTALRQAQPNLSSPVRLCLTFPDFFNKQATAAVSALNSVLGPDCPIFGGVAARQYTPEHIIQQFFNEEVVRDSIPLLLFAGPIRYGFAMAGGWKPIGRPAVVTQTKGGTVRRIGNVSALEFYRHYLGVHETPAKAFPLAVYEPDSTDFYLREPVEYHPENGCITFSEAIPEGCRVQITEGLRDSILDAVRQSVQTLLPRPLAFKPGLALAISCSIRKEVLGTRLHEELEILQDALPAGTPVIGFHGFGEIGPTDPKHSSFFHNAALFILVLGERSAVAEHETASASGLELRAAPPRRPAADVCADFDELRQEIAFLRKLLARSERYRKQLEEVKELSAALYRNVVQEVDAAHLELQQKEQVLRRTEGQYRRIVEAAGEGFFMVDENLGIVDTNEAYCKMVGYSREELLGRHIFDLASTGYREFLEANRGALINEENRKLEGILMSKDGRQVPVLIHGNILRDADGSTLGHVAFVTDLSEQMALQKELLVSEMRYRGMYENAVQGMFQMTMAGRFIRVNPAFARMLGYESPYQLHSEESTKLLYEEPAAFGKMAQTARKKGAVSDYELRLKRKDGSTVWIMANLRYIHQQDEESFLEGIAVDHTARKIAEDELKRSREMFRHLAIHDSLTGLFNTRYLYRALEDLIIESEAGQTPFSLVFMDMDNFKRVVDTYGHLNGSQALKEVAATIEECLVEPAFGVAYGGDEFVAVLPGMNREQAFQKAEEIRTKMKETVYLANQGLAINLCASFGIATFPDDASDLTGLLALADRAMFHAKEHGKDAIALTPQS